MLGVKLWMGKERKKKWKGGGIVKFFQTDISWIPINFVSISPILSLSLSTWGRVVCSPTVFVGLYSQRRSAPLINIKTSSTIVFSISPSFLMVPHPSILFPFNININIIIRFCLDMPIFILRLVQHQTYSKSIIDFQ